MAQLQELNGSPCPFHPGATIIVAPSGNTALCKGGTYDEAHPKCGIKTLRAYATELNGHGPPAKIESAPRGDGAPDADTANDHKVSPHLNGTAKAVQARPSFKEWQGALQSAADVFLYQDEKYQVHVPAANLIDPLVSDIKISTSVIQRMPDPEGYSRSDLDEEIERIAKNAIAVWAGNVDLDAALPVVQGANAVADLPSIQWEGFDDALIANEEYLKRTPVIDKLCYSNAVSMITGGKHAGKSTLARWMAVCVAKGWPVLGRQVTQGPVFYIASEDETMAARQELIRLGWTANDPLRFYPAQNVDDPDKFLHQLVVEIEKYGVLFVVLDMLFDFVRIADEMSYAGTREALGKIQDVATRSGAHLVAIHHAPKNAMIGDAAVAALGSQGLAARVSPIILVRRFGPGVHSVSSTEVRDPRGSALTESRLVRNVDGSVTLGGAWKNYMLAEVYLERVQEFLTAEPGSESTIGDVVDGLQITYEVARSCLTLMWKQGLAHRSGEGKKGRPFRYSATENISQANGLPNGEDSPQGRGDVGNNEPSQGYVDPNSQGRFGYKD